MATTARPLAHGEPTRRKSARLLVGSCWHRPIVDWFLILDGRHQMPLNGGGWTTPHPAPPAALHGRRLSAGSLTLVQLTACDGADARWTIDLTTSYPSSAFFRAMVAVAPEARPRSP